MYDCDLALTYSTNKLAVEELVAQLKHDRDTNVTSERYFRASIHQFDLSDPQACVRLCEDVRQQHGRPVDILVSNAGYGKRIPDIWDISVEEFEYTLRINLTASFVLTKCVVEDMKKQNWGRIIYVSSIAAYGAGLNGCHYAASKGGLTSMMKNLSSKLGPYGITVNDVAPAMIQETGMIPGASAFPGLKESIPVGRLGYVEEVANVVAMYCTTGYATGQSFLLAGGLNHK